MYRNLDIWLKQMAKELRWLPADRRDEILTELRGDLAEAAALPTPAHLAAEILSTELKISQAGFGRRALAFGIDFVLSVAVSVAFILPIALVPRPEGPGLLVIIPLALTGIATAVLWFPFFEAIIGQTPGKMLLGLAVVGEDGRPCTWGQAWIRRIPYLANALFLIDAVFVFFLPLRQRAFDRVAKTLVIIDPRGGVINE